MDSRMDSAAWPPGACLAPKDLSLLKTDSFASTDTAVGDAAAAGAAANANANANAANALALRRRHFAPNATLAHADAPLSLSRGEGCRLQCALTGRLYLDAQNNVAHLGHGHHGVARAVGAQLLALNTNSRYLDGRGELGLYCGELVATLPERMGQDDEEGGPVVFLTNSGSEANDLALRLARARHDERFGGGGDGPGDGDGSPPPPAFHAAVLGGAYHGHLDSVVQLSPYKFWAAPPTAAGGGDNGGASSAVASGAARRRKPDWVHVVPLPDEFESGRATRFCDGAAAARAVAAAARRAGGRIGLVIAEPLPSCAGQCPLPPGFLAALFSTLRREEGAVCCVDEVQTGFGRVGPPPHFWAFEPQLLPFAAADGDCLPDLVTMGKPMGNGFPLAGLMARRGAARAFCELSGEAYFNTFGGSNASVAAGRAVLRAVREERLPERAAAAGAVLGALLARVAAAHPSHVRDVRGAGLFWGVEIGRRAAAAATDADDDDAAVPVAVATAAAAAAPSCCWWPAPAKAAFVARRMRDVSGVLVSVDGVYGNVLKVKPPMVFGAAEGRELAAALDAALWALESGALSAGEAAALEARERAAWASAVAPVREAYERNARELGLLD